MTLVGLFLAASMTIGLAAQSCTLSGTGFTIDDLSDHVVITNTSATEVAMVSVSTALGSVDLDIPPGTSGTAWFLAARKYTLVVFAADDPSGATYKQSLLDLRSQLQDITLTPEAPTGMLVRAVTELSIVQAALGQLHASQSSQSCSGPIKTGVDSQATLTWTASGLSGTGIWSLNCG